MAKVDWSKCPSWCEEDECEAGWHQLAAGIGLVNARRGGLTIRINRNYKNGDLEIDYWLGGNGSHVFTPTHSEDLTSLTSRSEMEEFIKELDKFQRFIQIAKTEIVSFYNKDVCNAGS
jgi:hypothetical protein